MEELPRYCDIRYTKKEGKFYRHNPSTVMRQVLGIKNKNFKTLEQVTIYAEKIDKEFADAQRRLNNFSGISPYSVRGLVSHFYETSYWYKLKPNSQHSYRQLLTFGCDFIPRGSNKPFGDHPYKNIDREFVDRLNVSVAQKVSNHRVLHMNKVFKRVFNVGIMHKKLEYNPFTMQELQSIPARKVLWTKTWLNQYVEKADEIGMYSLGTIALFCFNLAQRPGDIRQLKEINLKNGTLTFVQEKSVTYKDRPPVELSFDLTHTHLKLLLDRLEYVKTKQPWLYDNPKDTCIIKYETTGRGLSRWNVIQSHARIRKLCGLPKELQMRDFRATGATELGLAGASMNELMSVTGHRDPKTVQVYLRNAEGMRANALDKLAALNNKTNHTN